MLRLSEGRSVPAFLTILSEAADKGSLHSSCPMAPGLGFLLFPFISHPKTVMKANNKQGAE